MPQDLSVLNSAQYQAVTHDQGPIILIAGAGTGKTTVISQRIAYLIEQNRAKADEILAMTFTDKAAGEMVERVDKLLPLGYADLWINTFHGFCERVLKSYGLDIGLPNDFKLVDKTASWMLVRQNLDRFDLDYYRPLGNPTKFIHALLNHFSRCKDEVVYPEDYLAHAEKIQLDTDLAKDREDVDQEAKRLKEIANSYHVYQQLLLDNNALDFGDLINYTIKLFKERPAILKKFREQFKYVLVDEFQDTNWAQYELIKLISAPKNNLMVVGDDDQAIYKFRGAAISNILNFKEEYGRPSRSEAEGSTSKVCLREVFLVDNYRSGQLILDCAYDFIQQNNPDRLEYQYQLGEQKLSKKLISHNVDKGDVQVLEYTDKNAEIDGVIKKIITLKKAEKDLLWSDFAILVRANEQASGFVATMRKIGLPHQYVASKGLYAQDITLDIMAYLKLLDNYHESTALFRILSLPLFNINVETIINLSHLANKKNWSLYHALHNYQGEVSVEPAEKKILDNFLSSLAKHTNLVKTQAVSQLIYTWLEDSGYLQLLTIEQTAYNQEQLNFLNQFYKKVRAWEEEALQGTTVHEFLRAFDLELESGEAGSLAQDTDEGPDVVKVMTVHGAKGLEFKYVFVTNLVHLRFPSTERKDPIDMPEEFIKEKLPTGDAHLQEERRLFYVALTRAKKAVFLTLAKDYGGQRDKKASQFLSELNLKFKPQVNKKNDTETAKVSVAVKKVKYPTPKHFSFSQLTAFESCPRQYFYAYIAKIPTIGNAHFSFGKTMHATLQQFFELIAERRSAVQADLFQQVAKIQEPTLKELLSFYEQSWIDEWYDSKSEEEKYKIEGQRILEEFFKLHAGHWPQTLYLEKGFNLKIGNYTIRGVIDRVDSNADGTWNIIDYKTGKVKDDKISFAEKKQLLIYQMAAEEIFQSQVASLTYYYLGANKPVTFIGSDKDKEKVKDWAKGIIEQILAVDFTATPGHVCSTCDFAQICPYAKLNK